MYYIFLLLLERGFIVGTRWNYHVTFFIFRWNKKTFQRYVGALQ